MLIIVDTLVFVTAMMAGRAENPQAEAKPLTVKQVKMRRYLTRKTPWSARYLDHGVLKVAGWGGVPAGYRLELALGLFDHFSVGVSTHWLPGQKSPQFAPQASFAFYRHRLLEIGMSYRQSLYAPQVEMAHEDIPSFKKQTHWFLGAMTFSRGAASVGFDAGVAHRLVPRESNPNRVSEDSRGSVEVAGGLHFRLGTRRMGIVFDALMVGVHEPELSVEGGLDVRFGLFELRPRGGWKIR